MTTVAEFVRDLAALLVAVWIAELLALAILFVQAWRNPQRKEPASRVPDFVPDDWLGGGSHETRPGGHGVGGDLDLYDWSDGPWPWHHSGDSVPDGDTKPATDTPSGDRGMEGQSS